MEYRIMRINGLDCAVTSSRTNSTTPHPLGFPYRCEGRFGDDGDESVPRTLERSVRVNFWGTLFFRDPVEFDQGANGQSSYAEVMVVEDEDGVIADFRETAPSKRPTIEDLRIMIETFPRYVSGIELVGLLKAVEHVGRTTPERLNGEEVAQLVADLVDAEIMPYFEDQCDDAARTYAIKAAELFSEETLSFDDHPAVSMGEDGAFVQCWHWVPENAVKGDDDGDDA